MSDTINITPQPANNVSVSNPITSVITVTDQTQTSVSVDLSTASVITLIAPGPQGPPGVAGGEDSTDYLMYYDLAKG